MFRLSCSFFSVCMFRAVVFALFFGGCLCLRVFVLVFCDVVCMVCVCFRSVCLHCVCCVAWFVLLV